MSDLKPVAAEDAATVIMVRDEGKGLEVYLTRRQDQLLFLGGYHVFPGGKVDEADRTPAMFERCRGLEPGDLDRRIEGAGDPARARGFFVAGARELFEEAGILLAEDDQGRPLNEPSPELAARLEHHRRELQHDRVELRAILAEEGLHLSLSEIYWFSQWITPATSPRRFNTFFFVTRKPPGQRTSPFTAEVREAVWASPTEAIERWRAGDWKMIPPTLASLDVIAHYPDWEALAADFSKAPSEHRRTVWRGDQLG